MAFAASQVHHVENAQAVTAKVQTITIKQRKGNAEMCFPYKVVMKGRTISCYP